MSVDEKIVIVGGGHSAGQAVASLRTEGFEGKITLIGDEPHIPYQRPPLSKGFLAGETTLDRVYFKPPEFYEKSSIDLILDTRAELIDREAHTVTVKDGKSFSYDKLLLALGSSVRRLPVPGVELAEIYYLRDIAHAEAIKDRFRPGARLVIVGGGYIGLEVASVAAQHGLDVTVLEMAPHLMSRVVDSDVAKFFAATHQENGVKIHYGATVTSFEGRDTVERVVCGDGSHFEANIVVIGVGIIPNTALAKRAGLECDNGIKVNEYAQTNDPKIFACGDCTNHPNRLLGRRIRLESVHNAIAQARVAAANLCGNQKEYTEIPWFWSDQYDLKLQIAGLSGDHDRVVFRGKPDAAPFSVFYLKQETVIAVNTVNNPQDFMAGKSLIMERANVPPEKLSDPAIAIKDMG